MILRLNNKVLRCGCGDVEFEPDWKLNTFECWNCHAKHRITVENGVGSLAPIFPYPRKSPEDIPSSPIITSQ